MNELVKECFIGHLLRVSFEQVLKTIKSKASSSPSCMVSYAWPTLPQEEGLPERVLQMVEDLKQCGVDAFIDVTRGDKSTFFIHSLPQWIEESDFVILVGSTSFPIRAKDPSTLTFLESTAIGKKKAVNSNSIIPVLFEGRFGTSFPPGYQDTIGGRFTKMSEYLKEMPRVVSSILGVSNDPDIATLLTSYTQEAESVIRRGNNTMTTRQVEEVTANLATQKQYWASKSLVLRSKFTLDQLKQIDGRVNIRTKNMDEYCNSIKAPITTGLPTTNSAEMDFEGVAILQALNIFDQVEEFLCSSSDKVLLLTCPLSTHALLLRSIAILSSCSPFSGGQHTLTPVLIDLTSIESPAETCIVETLSKHGLDFPTIQQAKIERSFFLFLVSGFENCGVPTNMYMRNKMYEWPGAKAIFTISPECMNSSKGIQYYFIPCSERSLQTFDMEAFKTISTLYKQLDSACSPSTSNSSTPVAPSVQFATSVSKLSPHAETQSTHDVRLTTTKVVSKYFENRKNHQQLMAKGFLLLQKDIIRVKCTNFLQQIRFLAFGNYTEFNPFTAFISYSWPHDITDRTHLQHQLVQLVEDLSYAGIRTLLDIMQLHPGSDVKQFMKAEIENSNTVLWIGTPELKARIKFDEHGKPVTNAAIEFGHIISKMNSTYPLKEQQPQSVVQYNSLLSLPWTLQSLLFRGNSPAESFPSGYSIPNIFHDFTNATTYYTQLPKLVAAIYCIPLESPNFNEAYNNYCKNIRLWEASFTETAIRARLQQEELEANKRQEDESRKLQMMLDNMPASYTKAQQDADHITFQALLSTLSQLKQRSLSPHLPHSQVLEYYVPLKGGANSDSDPAQLFDAHDRIQFFLSTSNSATVSILFGAAGAGKSLFARFIEQSLWKSWDPNQHKQYGLGADGVIPIFISLPQHFSPESRANLDDSSQHQLDLIEKAFSNLQFSAREVTILKRKVRFLFILDGLDEIPLELLPINNFLQQTNVVTWLSYNENNNLNHKVIITSRTQQVPIIETKIGKNIQEYFCLSTSPANAVAAFHLMPFNASQIELFLQGYSLSSEAKLNSAWTAQQYQHRIKKIGGLMSLIRNPFTLRLVAGILPQLVQRQKNTATITTADIYHEFTRQSFERETWKRLSQSQVPLSYNLMDELQRLCESIALLLFERSSTMLPLQDISKTNTQLNNEQLQHLFVNIPVHISNGEIRFIHKSLQEYFIAQAWLNHFNTLKTSHDDVTLTRLLSTNFVSRETGILRFLSQMIQHHLHAGVLLHQVILSRYDKSMQQQVASSNAMTILNAARFSFSGMDLSNISVPNANLQHAVMDQTNLSHSNFSGCILLQAWMKNANLANSLMANVELGELPWIDYSSICCSICGNEKLGRFLTGHANGTVLVWDIQTMEQVGKPLQGHTGPVVSVVIYAGKIISASYDKIIVWDMDTMTLGTILAGDNISSVAAYNGKIISGGEDNTITLWDLKTTKQLGEPLQGHTGAVTSVAVYNSKIITGSSDNTIIVWNMETMMQIGDPLQGHIDSVNSVAVYNGKIVSGSSDKTIIVWNMETMMQIGNPLQGHTDSVNSVAVYNGKIASGSNDKTIRVWDLENMIPLGDSLRGHTDCVMRVAFHNDKIISGSWDKTIKVWNIDSMQEIHNQESIYGGNDEMWDLEATKEISDPLQSHTDSVTSVAVHNGKIVSGSKDHTIRLWNMETMKQIGDPFQGHTDSVISVAVHNGKIVTGSSDNTIRVWDMETMVQIGNPLQGHTNTVMSVVIHNGKIISGSSDKTIRVWDMETMVQIGNTLEGHSGRINSVTVHNNKIISGSEDKTIRLWDMDTLKQSGYPLKGHSGGVMSVAVHNDKIVSGSSDTTIIVWDMETMVQIGRPLKGHTGAVTSVAVYNGKIVSGSSDNTIKVWNMGKKQPIGETLKAHTDSVTSVAFHNGKIVSGSNDKTIKVWDLEVMLQTPLHFGIHKLPDNSSGGGYLIQSTSQLPLCFEGCNIDSVEGLSDKNKRAIRQRLAMCK